MSNHVKALDYLARGPATRQAVEDHCGLSMRHARRVLADLVAFGMVNSSTRGRTWIYTLTGTGEIPKPNKPGPKSLHPLPKSKPRIHAARRQDQDRARIEADLEQYLANGGKIREVPGYVQAPAARVVNVRGIYS